LENVQGLTSLTLSIDSHYNFETGERIKTHMEESWFRYEINVLKDDQRPQSLHWR